MQARDRFSVINGLRLHHLEWGVAAAPPVVLLHGGAAHAHWWDRFAAAIAGNYHVLAPDLRGHGDSEHAVPAAYQVGDYVRDVAAFIDVQKLDRFHLIGHSLGGMVATALGGQRPDRLRSLVVVDSQLKITLAGARYMLRLRNFPQPEYRSRQQAIERFRLLPTQTAAEEQTLRQIAAHSFRELPDGRWTFKFDRESMAHNTPQDLTPLLSRLACPILVVRGAHSTLLPPAALTRLRAGAPQAQTAEISAAHHHVMLDNPLDFELAVRRFLETVDRGTRDDATPTLEPSNP